MSRKSPLLEPDMECLICMDDISNQNYVQYQFSADEGWFLAFACKECIEEYRMSKFHTYVSTLKTTKCAAEQRRLLESGPPIYLTDKNLFPSSEDGSCLNLYYSSNDINGGVEFSAMLDGALTGEERLVWWEEQKKFRISNDTEDI